MHDGERLKLPYGIPTNAEYDVNIRLIKNNCCQDGFYLKWHNGKWGYSYYLFNKVGRERLNPKSIGSVREYLSWSENEIEISKKGQRQIQLFAMVDYQDREMMKSLVMSNEVYLYTGLKHQKANKNLWLKVRIKGKVDETNKSKTFKQTLTLLMPNEQTRSLL